MKLPLHWTKRLIIMRHPPNWLMLQKNKVYFLLGCYLWYNPNFPKEGKYLLQILLWILRKCRKNWRHCCPSMTRKSWTKLVCLWFNFEFRYALQTLFFFRQYSRNEDQNKEKPVLPKAINLFFLVSSIQRFQEYRTI